MVAYLDSSVVLQHILMGDEGIRQFLACDSIISSELIEIECKRVVHRYRLKAELDDSGFLEALDRIDKVLSGLSILHLSDSVKKRSAEAFPIVVKTLDALHLSSAIAFVNEHPGESILVFSYDQSFNRSARALGFSTPFSTDT
ncbi:MAG: PIN domain-containing protein [Spirochaetales bacterium]|jgi:hypothetical protein|nr:PIN domain-containing protein [Spirochaetales bacterium]